MIALAAQLRLFYRTGIVKKSHRKVIVFSTLLGVLSLTSALLLALAPAPLTPDAATSLFAFEQPHSMDAIFETRTPVPAGRWKYIYIHHSQTPAGNAFTLGQSNGPAGVGDHFVIGNGDGCIDGEIQLTQRWNNQQTALPPAGANKVDEACISICLVGDFDRTIPTQTQLRRLTQLVGALQGQLHVAGSGILLPDAPQTPAGIGRYFPKSAFRAQLLP